jgi:hypothetical protein
MYIRLKFKLQILYIIYILYILVSAKHHNFLVELFVMFAENIIMFDSVAVYIILK